MNLALLCKGQVIKGSSADSYVNSFVVFICQWVTVLETVSPDERALKVTFFVTLSVFLINGCVHDSTLEMVWRRHFRGYSASTQTNIAYKWKNRTELFGSMNCQNTCELQSLEQAIKLIYDGDKNELLRAKRKAMVLSINTSHSKPYEFL